MRCRAAGRRADRLGASLPDAAGAIIVGFPAGVGADIVAPCQRLAPDADSFHALALRRLIQPPITEEEIAAKEKDIKRLRVRLGFSRWCKRYAGQMEQARILVQVLRRQK